MKKIVLLSIFALSLFSVACGSDATTCEEAYQATKDACESSGLEFPSQEVYVKNCEAEKNKDAGIECTNRETCDEILSCQVGL